MNKMKINDVENLDPQGWVGQQRVGWATRGMQPGICCQWQSLEGVSRGTGSTTQPSNDIFSIREKVVTPFDCRFL